MAEPRSSPPRRRTRLRRLIPLLVLAAGAFAGGLVAGGRHEPSERRLAIRFVAAWERGDYASMHAMLTPQAREQWPLQRFARAYRRAEATATVARLRASRPRKARDDTITVPVDVRTRIFGDLRTTVTLPLGERDDGQPAVAWQPHLVFARAAAGRGADAATRGCPRARRSRRATARRIAHGEARLSDLDALASEIAGRVGPAPPERAEELAAQGVPDGAPVGLTGLEREFDRRLAGTPGGQLLAGARVLAATTPRRGRDVRTTIDPDIQRAAVEALAGRYGGIAAVRPRNGEVLALAGVAFSAPAAAGLGVQDHHARRARSTRASSSAARASRSRRRRRSRASSSRTPTASRAAAR